MKPARERGRGVETPEWKQPVEILGRMADAYVQGLPAQRRPRLWVSSRFPTSGSAAGLPRSKGQELKDIRNLGKPRRQVGRRLKGYSLTRNADPLTAPTGGLFVSPEEAMAEANILGECLLGWRRAATTPEGHDYLIGGHPAMIDFEQRFPAGFPFGIDQQEAYQSENERLRGSLQPNEWWDRWHIAPEYAPVMETVKGAIRPNPRSAFYVEPSDDGRSWFVRSGIGKRFNLIGHGALSRPRMG